MSHNLKQKNKDECIHYITLLDQGWASLPPEWKTFRLFAVCIKHMLCSDLYYIKDRNLLSVCSYSHSLVWFTIYKMWRETVAKFYIYWLVSFKSSLVINQLASLESQSSCSILVYVRLVSCDNLVHFVMEDKITSFVSQLHIEKLIWIWMHISLSF